VDDGPYADALIAVIPVLGVHAQVMADSMALIWMNPAQQGFNKRAVDAVRNTPGLNLQGGAPLIERILYSLNQSFNDPTTDPRMPDITVIATPGVIYTGGSKLGEHGAFGKDDISVALLVSHPSLNHRTFKSPVRTTQSAPTILEIPGLEGSALESVRKEHTDDPPGFDEKESLPFIWVRTPGS